MDLRDHIKKLEEAGELRTVKQEVHWNLEAPALCAISNRAGGPAIHFTNVKGYSDCSLVGSLFSGPGTLYKAPKDRLPWGRLALGLGMDRRINYEDLMSDLLARRKQPLLPTKVTTGECKEVVKIGEKVDVFEFPFTINTEKDGGRYGTAGILACKDRDSDWLSWGVHRFMIHSRDEIVVYLMPNSDAATVFAKYEAHNEPMPCCFFFGGDPACFLSAAMPLAPGISETEIAGGLSQDPIEMVKAETIDMLVPGNSELVIEGELLPKVRKEEGPFAEYVRYSDRTLQPVMKIKAITHRAKPVIPFVMEGCKVSDSMAIISIGVSLELKRGVDTERMFKVRWVNLPVDFKLGLLVVATQVPYKGYNYFIAKYLLSKKRKSWFDKIMIVDSDIVPVDLWEVINDFAQKTDTRAGKGVIAEELEYPLTPTAGWATKAERERGAAHALVYDCTWKDNWPKEEIPVRITFENTFPKEIQEKVLANWKKYGFTMEPEVKRAEEKWSRGLLMAR